MNVPSLSLITENNRHIARAIMLIATLYFAWRMAGLLWLIAGQDQADFLHQESRRYVVAPRRSPSSGTCRSPSGDTAATATLRP